MRKTKRPIRNVGDSEDAVVGCSPFCERAFHLTSLLVRDRSRVTTIGDMVFLAIAVAPFPLFPLLRRKGWLHQDRTDNIFFAVMTFLAVMLVWQVVDSAKLHWLNKSLVIGLIAAMWNIDWRSRERDKKNLDAQMAVLAGYIVDGHAAFAVNKKMPDDQGGHRAK